MTLLVGARLGPYQVTAKIQEGGMGEVYQARNQVQPKRESYRDGTSSERSR